MISLNVSKQRKDKIIAYVENTTSTGVKDYFDYLSQLNNYEDAKYDDYKDELIDKLLAHALKSDKKFNAWKKEKEKKALSENQNSSSTVTE